LFSQTRLLGSRTEGLLCLRLKKNEFVQLEGEIWLQLEQLGLVPGMQLYLDGVSVTKQKDLVQCCVQVET